MNDQNIDRVALKSVVSEILLDNPKYFKDIILEILLEHQIIVSEEQEERRKKLVEMISGDFDKYDEVFKSLA
jgi:hypothetical protein